MNRLLPEPPASSPAIGVFDSGFGGLSVLREIHAAMPSVDLIYFGDQIHVPYGQRSLKQVRHFSRVITDFLLGFDARQIVIACNTASAAALTFLRKEYPQIPFVGMEPAVKPAAEVSRTRAVAVLATPATFQSRLYASVLDRFAKNVSVYQHTCPGLVNEIEKGNFDGQTTRTILENALLPLLEKEIDTIVLGCTHYPYVIPLIKQIAGPNVKVIDPAPAVAAQTKKIYGNQFEIPDLTRQAHTRIISSNPKEGLPASIADYYPYPHKLISAKWDQDERSLNITQ